MSARSGRVWLVGAGPGDPDLLTVAARRLIDAADAVVHDRLVGPAILASIPQGTLRFDVGKVGYGDGIHQDETVSLLVGLARRGFGVVRLKGGDPFVFGRGGEEALALRAAGVPFQVVPGVTAGVAGPALASIPVTHRGLSRSVAFVTASGAGGQPQDWAAVAGAETLVVYMAGRSAAAVARGLRAAGRGGATPVAVVADASLPTEHVDVVDLDVLERVGVDVHTGAAVLLVVGEVVRLRAAIGPLTYETTQ